MYVEKRLTLLSECLAINASFDILYSVYNYKYKGLKKITKFKSYVLPIYVEKRLTLLSECLAINASFDI